MVENQNVEWKESWRDEYLKWICGFANALGGKIYIGINDKGEVVGLADSKKLLEDIPNKVRDILGIIVDVNLLKEAVYNAIIHSNYAAQIPIQISVYADKLYISNDCIFPVGWTVETLMEKHRSQPYNPSIANGFFRAGYVETWGRGIEKIWDACKKHGIPKPEYCLHPEDIMVKFMAGKKPKTPKHQNEALDEALETKVLNAIRQNPQIRQLDLTKQLKLSRATIQRLIKSLTDEGYLVRINGKRYGHWEIKENRVKS